MQGLDPPREADGALALRVLQQPQRQYLNDGCRGGERGGGALTLQLDG